nr:hypothetical protein [Tanacetum cinerariifolium]
MSNDRVFCRPCMCERCRRNYTDRFCAICCVESGNAFIDDLITNSFDDLLNSSNHLPQHQTHTFESNGDPPQNSDFCQLIGEMCGIKASAGKKQKLEEMMLEWLELCREKELYRVHDSIKDLIGRAMNTMLLSINLKSQRLDKEKREVKNIVEQAYKRRTRTTESLQNFKIIYKKSSISLNNTPQISPVIENTPDLPTKEPESSLMKSLIDPIPPRIEEADFDLEEEIRLVENLFDSHMEEIDLFLATDDLMPSSIKNEDYDSERDIHFPEELLSDDLLPLPENESSNFDHHDDPLFPRSPLEPPDVEVFFDFEPDTGVLTAKVVEDISEHYVCMPKVLPSQPTLYSNIHTLLPFSSENENKVFKPGILSYLLVSHRYKITSDFSKNPMMMYGGDIPLLDVSYLHFHPP